MKCETRSWFPAESGDEGQCPNEAEVRSDCVPTGSDSAGTPDSVFLCRACADAVQDSESWIYSLTDVQSGEEYVQRHPEYDGVPVFSKDLPRMILNAFVGSDQFVDAAAEALDCIRRWEVTCVRIEVDGDGILAYTRAGEKVRVRFAQ